MEHRGAGEVIARTTEGADIPDVPQTMHAWEVSGRPGTPSRIQGSDKS
jgi:hypothetical protein